MDRRIDARMNQMAGQAKTAKSQAPPDNWLKTNQYLKPLPEKAILPNFNILPSEDAVDDQLRHNLYVLTGITMGYLNLRAQEV